MTNKQKLNIFFTSVVIFIAVIAVGFVFFPKLVNYKTYSIQTGSMEPNIHKGSMIYVKECKNFSDYKVGDVVTFTDFGKTKSFTHRIVAIDEENQMFTTKGDANEENDLEPTSAMFAVGKVEFAVPYLGYVATFLNNTATKISIAVIYIAWLAIEIEIYITERKKKYE
ncbi:MAG: signal peptidase I [Clostridia bacterium]|nr:signal peptidase I [Clostridia bacterium]